MSWLRGCIASLIPVLGALVLFAITLIQQGTITRLKADNDQLVRERDVARLQLQNQQRALALFNQLSKASIDEKNANQRHLEQERQQVRTALADVDAARMPVPAAVADRVRHAVDAIRADSAAADAR